jgi:hypothetical protein
MSTYIYDLLCTEEEEEDTGPLGNLRRNWNELNEALNCYGAVTEARDACAPRRMRSLSMRHDHCDAMQSDTTC